MVRSKWSTEQNERRQRRLHWGSRGRLDIQQFISLSGRRRNCQMDLQKLESRETFSTLSTRATNATKDHRRSIKKFNTRKNLISARHPIENSMPLKIIIISLLTLNLHFSYAQTIALEKVHRTGFDPFFTSTKDGEYQVNFDGEVVNLSKKSDGVITCRIKSNTRNLIEDGKGKLHKPRILEASCPELTDLMIIEDIKGGVHMSLNRFMDGMRYRSSLEKLKSKN